MLMPPCNAAIMQHETAINVEENLVPWQSPVAVCIVNDNLNAGPTLVINNDGSHISCM